MAAFTTHNMLQQEILFELLSDDDDDDNLIIEAIHQVRLTHQAILATVSDRDVDPNAKIHNFVEEIVPRYTPWQFKSHFRMHPGDFEVNDCIYVYFFITMSI